MDKKQNTFGSPSIHFTFDFRGKRVKLQRNDGKFEVKSKFSLCYDIGMILFYKGLYAEDIYNYAECKQILLELLESRNFDNVTIIK